MPSNDANPTIELYDDGDETWLRVGDRITCFWPSSPGESEAQRFRFRAVAQAVLDGELDIETCVPEPVREVCDFDEWRSGRGNRALRVQSWRNAGGEPSSLERVLWELMRQNPEHMDPIELASDLTGFDYDEIVRRLNDPAKQNSAVMAVLMGHIK